MKVLIVASKLDIAGVNIANELRNLYDFKETDLTFEGNTVYRCGNVLLAYMETDTIYAEHIAENFEVDAVIFVSRHSGGKPCLTTHVPGNLRNEAKFGGKPREICWANPKMVKSALTTLVEAKEDLGLEKYDVSMEVTHHGPSGLPIPCMFVEIGCSPEEWRDMKAVKAAATAAWNAATREAPGELSVGFGGEHYARKHTRVSLKCELAIGHIVPKYIFDDEGFSEWLVKEPVRKTWGGCEIAAVEWKGLRGEDRRRVIEVLEGMDIEWVKI